LSPEEVFELYSIPAFDDGSPERVQGAQIGSAKQIVESDDVLLSRIVPHIRRAWVVNDHTGLRQIGSGEWIIFRSKRFYSHYLRHILVSDQFHLQFMQTVAGVGGSLLRARPAQVADIRIPLPPLPEQKRIATILDAAEALREKRHTAIRRLDELEVAVFNDIFGDPQINTKKWPTARLDEIVNGRFGIKAGPFGSALKKEEYSESGYRVYGQEQVIAGRFDVGNYYINEGKFRKLESCQAREGDILVSLVGSFGKVLIVPKGIEPGIINPRLLKITPDLEVVTSQFVASVLKHPATQSSLQHASHGGTMGILNAGLLKGLTIALPPLELQLQYESVLERVRALQDQLLQSKQTCVSLFASLQARAFGGRL
jgi:type I restriction enzyme S subunit